MNTKEFRDELTKIMPGYKWTVKTPYRFKTDTARGQFAYLCAIGIQSAGFNRTSTLQVERRIMENGDIEYETSIADYGTRGPWVATGKENTLARALRYVQDRCETMERLYRACAFSMQSARVQKGEQKA